MYLSCVIFFSFLSNFFDFELKAIKELFKIAEMRIDANTGVGRTILKGVEF